MSKYPYWDNRNIFKLLTVNLEINVPVTLHDALFYGDRLVVTDATGTNMDVRIHGHSQDQKETALAGEGVYGTFEISSSPVNPCQISYVPRFLITDEDLEYIQDTFNYVKDTDISKLTNNIDDLVQSVVNPQVDADLSLGNFTNGGRLVASLRRLTKMISSTYFAIDSLPEAIEDIYLNAKGGTQESLDAMRKMSPKPLDINAVMTDSVRILSNPPEGKMFGNAIYIAWGTVTFEYEGEHTLRLGDIVIIDRGVMSILPFGTDYYNRIDNIDYLISTLDQYATLNQPTLISEEKNIELVVTELEHIIERSKNVTLGLNLDVHDASAFDNSNTSVLLGLITNTFEYDNVVYEDGNLILMEDGTISILGLTKGDTDKLFQLNTEIFERVMDVRKLVTPIETLTDLVASVSAKEIPSVNGTPLVMTDKELKYGEVDIVRSDLANAISDSLDTLGDTSRYTNDDEVKNIVPSLYVPDSTLVQFESDVSAVKSILANKTLGSFIGIPRTKISYSGIYYGSVPVKVTDEQIDVAGYGRWNVSGLAVTEVRLIQGLFYLETDTGIYELDPSLPVPKRPDGLKSAEGATKVIPLGDSVAVVSTVGESSIVETPTASHVVAGGVVGGISGGDLVIYFNGAITKVHNLKTGNSLVLPYYVSRTIDMHGGTMLVNGNTIIAVVIESKIYQYQYPDGDLGDTILTDGFPNPTIKVPNCPIGLEIKLL